MPFQNFNNRHFSDQEKTTLETLMTQLETGFAGKLANLTPDERKQYGSVNEQNKLIINKVKELADNQPDLKSPDIDWQEFNADYESRRFLESMLGRIERLFNDMTSAKILHDYDNYKDSLTEYEYSKYRNNMETPGFAVKVKELKQFFAASGIRPSSTNTEENTTENTEDDM